jgi:hypothetical protein
VASDATAKLEAYCKDTGHAAGNVDRWPESWAASPIWMCPSVSGS